MIRSLSDVISEGDAGIGGEVSSSMAPKIFKLHTTTTVLVTKVTIETTRNP